MLEWVEHLRITSKNVLEYCWMLLLRSKKIDQGKRNLDTLLFFTCLPEILLFCLNHYKRVEPFYFFFLPKLLPIHLLYPCFKLPATFTITKLVNLRIEVRAWSIARSSLSRESFIIITNYECVQLKRLRLLRWERHQFALNRDIEYTPYIRSK